MRFQLFPITSRVLRSACIYVSALYSMIHKISKSIRIPHHNICTRARNKIIITIINICNISSVFSYRPVSILKYTYRFWCLCFQIPDVDSEPHIFMIWMGIEIKFVSSKVSIIFTLSQNNVIVIDEAHNLIDTVNAVHSCRIDRACVSKARAHLAAYLKRYSSRLNPSNLLYIRHLTAALNGFAKMLSTKSATTSVFKWVSYTVNLYCTPCEMMVNRN